MYGKEIKKVHGPYKRNDGRFHVVVVFVDESKKNYFLSQVFNGAAFGQRT